ncbi:hypothetical protein [Streptomyces sp. KLOTTS4A1]|uniref:hypothetical protein n=1 Tax=Streptomyces sp. KLOTTS4A1 TaxID=3390996 RepID=UPI0039F455BB
MRRSDERTWLHPFRPGRLILGLAMGAVALAYGGEVAGWWETEWFAAIPIVVLGLFLASVAGTITYLVGHRRGARGGGGRDGAAGHGPEAGGRAGAAGAEAGGRAGGRAGAQAGTQAGWQAGERGGEDRS